MSHPMMASANHDERSEQLFTRDLKAWIATAINPPTRQLAEAVEARYGEARSFDAVQTVFEDLLETDGFRSWIALKRMAQEMMWDSVAKTVDRELDVLTARGRIDQPMGSLTLDPDFKIPAYISRMDTHLMPGGYAIDDGEGGIRQGALMDAGGAVYQLGRPMGPRNDRAGTAAITHLIDAYPGLEPKRILDLGTGIGRAAVCAALRFPEAEVHGVDVGPSVLRYAHARAERLDAAVHFSQQDAEATHFPDGHFDLVVSTAIFHETSDPSIPRIIAEARRLLRPGGVMVNMEVPYRYWEEDILGKLEAEWETHYNNESAYRAAVSVDYDALMRDAGFDERKVGWQAVTAEPGQGGFTRDKPKGAFALYVASARK